MASHRPQCAGQGTLCYNGLMKKTFLYIQSFAFLWLLPSVCAARNSFDTSLLDFSGFVNGLTIGGAFGNLISMLSGSIFVVALSVFVWGAFLYAGSGEKEDRKSEGRNFMINAVIGMLVVVGVHKILDLVIHFIYAS